MSTIDIEQLDDVNERRKDFRRANGAPLVSDPDNPDKSLRYSRPSSYGKNLDDENALVEWRIWKAMTGVARSRALAAEVNATRYEDKEAKRSLRDKAMDKGDANEAADMGTALHAMTARMEDDSDIDFDPPEQYIADLDAYVTETASYGLISVCVEVQIVNDEYRTAGTADRVYKLHKALQPPSGPVLPAGTLVVGDIKTGKSLDFSAAGFNVQTALYATGTFYDVVTERRIATPDINQDWTLLVHLPVGKARCTLYWCSVELGLYGAWLSKEVKEWQKRWKNGTNDTPQATPPETALEVIERVQSDPVLSEDLLPEMMGYCRQRLARIRDIPEAKEYLVKRWPPHLPRPADIHEPIEVVWLLNLLDEVEKVYSIPFMKDPRVDMQNGHKSMTQRDNNFQLIPTSKGDNDE